MLGKKGHLGNAIIAVGAFILVGIAIYGMLTFNATLDVEEKELFTFVSDFDYNNEFVRGAFSVLVEQAKDTAAREGGANFETAFRTELTRLAQKRREIWKDKTNLFGKLETGDYTLNHNNGDYTINLIDVFVRAQHGKSEIKKTFDLNKRFSFIEA